MPLPTHAHISMHTPLGLLPISPVLSRPVQAEHYPRPKPLLQLLALPSPQEEISPQKHPETARVTQLLPL